MNAIIESSLVSAAFDADKKKVREKGGNNRGPEVREYLRSVGLNEGFAWCAAFVAYHLLKAGLSKHALPNGPASACNWLHNFPREFWMLTTDPQRGDIGGWCGKGWKGHLFRVVKSYSIAGVRFIQTIEGNTGPDGGRDGDGAYRKTRRITKDMLFLRYKA